MIRFFKSLQPAILIFIPFIVLIFWVRTIMHSNPVTDPNVLPLWSFVTLFFSGLPSWLNFILLFALISWEAIYLNLILNRHEVLYKNTFVPALIFAFTISCTPLIMQFHPVHVINLLMLYILDKSFTMYKIEFPVKYIFDSALLAGVASLIYFPAIILLPMLLTMLGVLRPFRLKEWLILIIGFLLPYFFISIYMFWTQSLVPGFSGYFHHFRNLKMKLDIAQNTSLVALAMFLGMLLLLSILKLRINFRKNIIRTRNYQQVFFIYLVYAIGWLILSGTITAIHFAFLFIPITVFCSYYFISAKRRPWLYEYILWLFVALIVWNHLA